MKFAIVSPDKNGSIDGTIQQYILAHLVQSSHPDAIVVPIAYHPNFGFNAALASIKKPIVILDFLEMGWDAGEKENRLGNGALRQFGHLDSEEWGRLDSWVRDFGPRLVFKRELHRKHQTERLLPVEFPCSPPVPPSQSVSEFNARPLEVFSSWGLSNPARQRLHGEVFKRAHDCGIHVVDGWGQDGRFEKRTWATIHSPWYSRKPREEVLRWNERSKISISLPGAGVKCFRTAEAPCGSIMALQSDSLAWSVPWIDGENCIRLEPGNEFSCLEAATRWDGLYDVYLRGQESARKYQPLNYVSEYLVPKIESAI